jgi:bacitracin transport system permease protein
MFKLLVTEIIKLRRTNMLWISIAGAFFAPFLNLLVYVQMRKNSGINQGFIDYASQCNVFIAILIGILLYGLLSSYLIDREFSEDMLKHILVIPINKTIFLINKIIILAIWLLIITIFSFILSVIFSYFAAFDGLNYLNLISVLIMFLKTFIIFIPLLMPVIFITLLFKGFVAPITFTIIVTIGNIMIINSKYNVFYPFLAPMISVEKFENNYYSTDWLIITALITGVIGFLLSFIYLKRKDIS